MSSWPDGSSGGKTARVAIQTESIASGPTLPTLPTTDFPANSYFVRTADMSLWRTDGVTWKGVVSTGGAAQDLLTWPPPETDAPVELTISAPISINLPTGTTVFAANANGVLMGSGPVGGGGGIAGVTIQISNMGTGGAVTFESSATGTGGPWTALTVTSVADAVTTTTTATAPGSWFVQTVGKTHVRVRATSLTSGTIIGSIHGNNCTGMMANMDYILYCPVPIVTNYPNIGGIKIGGGRNIIWIGGEINVPFQNLSGSDTYSRALYVDSNSGIIHLEGLYFHGVDLSDGFQLFSHESIVQIQNCHVGLPNEAITAHDLTGWTDKHPDIIEGEGGWRELRVDKLTGWSQYQGLFLNQVTGKHARFASFRRVDINGAVNGVPTGSRQLLWQGPETGRTVLEDVYIQPHTEKTNLNKWNTLFTTCHPYGTVAEPDVNSRQVVIQPPGLSNPTSADSPTSSRWIEESAWPPKPAILGHVKLGPPPGGEFAPLTATGPGCSYVSPGYLHKDEVDTFTIVSTPLAQGQSVRPVVNKLKMWSFDPAHAVTSSAPPQPGMIYLTKLMVEETLQETTGFVVVVEDPGIGLVANQCWLALYDRIGTKLATSADLSTTFNSAGQKSVVLTDVAPYTSMATHLLGGSAEFVYAGWLFNWTGAGSQGPKVSAAYDSAGSDADNNPRALALNMGVDGTGGGLGPTGKFVIRFHKNLSGQTTLPGALFFTGSKPSNFAPLIGFN